MVSNNLELDDSVIRRFLGGVDKVDSVETSHSLMMCILRKMTSLIDTIFYYCLDVSKKINWGYSSEISMIKSSIVLVMRKG